MEQSFKVTRSFETSRHVKAIESSTIHNRRSLIKYHHQTKYYFVYRHLVACPVFKTNKTFARSKW